MTAFWLDRMENQIKGLNGHRVRTLVVPASPCLLSTGFETVGASPACMLNEGFETLGRRGLRRHFHVKTHVDAGESAETSSFLVFWRCSSANQSIFYVIWPRQLSETSSFYVVCRRSTSNCTYFFVFLSFSTSKSTKKSTILQKMKKCFSPRKLERRSTSTSIFALFFVFWVGRQPKIIGWGTLFQFNLFFLNGRLAEKTRAGANFFSKKNEDFWLGPKFWLEFFR